MSCVEGPVLSLGNGAFSEKWGEMSQRLGLETDAPGRVGQAHLAGRREEETRGETHHVTVVHGETSTGVLNNLAAIAKVVRENSDALVFADAVTSGAGTKVEADDWGLDVVL